MNFYFVAFWSDRSFCQTCQLPGNDEFHGRSLCMNNTSPLNQLNVNLNTYIKFCVNVVE